MNYEYTVLIVVSYQVIGIHYPDGEYKRIADEAYVSEIQMVNDLGEQGWEMVAASYYYDNHEIGRIWLKREYQ